MEYKNYEVNLYNTSVSFLRNELQNQVDKEIDPVKDQNELEKKKINQADDNDDDDDGDDDDDEADEEEEEDVSLTLCVDSESDLDDEILSTQEISLNGNNIISPEKCYCVQCILNYFSTFKTAAEKFPNLYVLYKYVALLPCTETKCERDFSHLKIIKNYRRSVLKGQKLESLMIIRLECDLFKDLELEDIINDSVHVTKIGIRTFVDLFNAVVKIYKILIFQK